MAGARSRRGACFRYEGVELDPSRNLVLCRYSLDGEQFTEAIRVDAPGADWNRPEVEAAARLIFMIAAPSYYKTGAPPTIDTGPLLPTPVELQFLESLFVDGLGEFAFRNGLDLTDIEFVGEAGDASAVRCMVALDGRPLVPFGGGIDSIVVAERTRCAYRDTALFISSVGGDRNDAIEAAAAVAKLPVLRADRQLDPKVVESVERGYLNGHVPVTAMLSAVAVLVAVLDGRSTVVMSNEWSASSATLLVEGREVNHQWSKSLAFEAMFRELLDQSIPAVRYFSALRPYSELWVAAQFAELSDYHATFRSCNRAFAVDPSRRLDHWCGECDKCVFIDLILAPYLTAKDLGAIFAGNEPLANPDLEAKFASLLGEPDAAKPFECVGDAGECRTAVMMASQRADRAENLLLRRLVQRIRASGLPVPTPESLLQPLGDHFIEVADGDDALVG